jgi:phage protein D
VTAIHDRSAPGVRISALTSERAKTGAPIDLAGRILSFNYEDTEEKADKVTLELDNNDLSLFDRAELGGGALWEVSWGYPGVMAAPRRVVVRKMTGFLTLRLEAHSLGVLLNREVKTRVFRDMTRGQVAAQIGRELGYDGPFLDVEEDDEVVPTIAQAAETDARFLRRLAARDHRLFFVDEDGFHFRARRPAREISHVFTWHNDLRGEILAAPHIESNLSARVGTVEVRGRDPLRKTTVSETADKDNVDRETMSKTTEVVPLERGKTYTVVEFLNKMVSLRTSAPTTKGKAKQEAAARFRKAEGGTVMLTMPVIGDPTLRRGQLVEIRGIGRRLSGIYHLGEARHAVTGQGYTCDLKLRRDGFSAPLIDGTTTHGQPQGGRKVNAKQRQAGELEPFEQVFEEAGPTILLYRRAGEPLGGGDPEAKK